MVSGSYRPARRTSPVFNYHVHHAPDNNCRTSQRSNVTLIVVAPVTIGSGIIVTKVRGLAPTPSMTVNGKINTERKNKG